jgi:hypothetical protein
MNTIKILLSITSFALILSCSCKQLYFTESDKLWAKPYKKGDLVIFQSNKDIKRRDTITILNKSHSIPSEDCNPAVSLVNSEFYLIEAKYSHDGKTNESDYLLQLDKDENGEAIPVIRIFDIEFSGSEIKDTVVIINNFGVQNCYSFNEFQDFENIPNFKIKNFIWSKQLGLVQYTTVDGEKYELIKK